MGESQRLRRGFIYRAIATTTAVSTLCFAAVPGSAAASGDAAESGSAATSSADTRQSPAGTWTGTITVTDKFDGGSDEHSVSTIRWHVNGAMAPSNGVSAIAAVPEVLEMRRELGMSVWSEATGDVVWVPGCYRESFGGWAETPFAEVGIEPGERNELAKKSSATIHLLNGGAYGRVNMSACTGESWSSIERLINDPVGEARSRPALIGEGGSMNYAMPSSFLSPGLVEVVKRANKWQAIGSRYESESNANGLRQVWVSWNLTTDNPSPYCAIPKKKLRGKNVKNARQLLVQAGFRPTKKSSTSRSTRVKRGRVITAIPVGLSFTGVKCGSKVQLQVSR